MSNKRINTEALKYLGKGAEVIEATASTETTPTNARRARLGQRKAYRSFSLSLVEEDYMKFLDYLDTNNIASGSDFLRKLLIEKGVLSNA
ncbi:hypothetical protein [Helicobacter sp. T3_23-1056]